MTLAPTNYKIGNKSLIGSSTADTRFRLYTETPIKEIFIIFPDTGKYLLVKVEKSVYGYWTATSDEISVYGDGSSFDKAVLDFLVVLEEYYKELLAEEDILGPFLVNELSKLKQYFH